MSPYTGRQPATKGYARRITFGAVVLLGLLIVGLQFKQSVDNVQTLRAGCERGNVQREALYRNTLRDARTRKAAVQQFTGRAQSVIRRQAMGGFRDAQALVDIYASVAQEPGSVEQACDDVYQLPFPL